MRFELDHLFVCAEAGAPEAERLVEFGLTEGGANTHHGQGTANRRFFFRNAMIELLWLRDAREARGERVAPTRLYERCNYRETGASPFGICLRPENREEVARPFEGWEYSAPYMPASVSLHVAASSRLTDEPLLFYAPSAVRPDEYAADRRQPLAHASGFREITSVRITLTKDQPYSDALSAVASAPWCFVASGAEHLLEVGFDGEARGAGVDFRPGLPLALRW